MGTGDARRREGTRAHQSRRAQTGRGRGAAPWLPGRPAARQGRQRGAWLQVGWLSGWLGRQCGCCCAEVSGRVGRGLGESWIMLDWGRWQLICAPGVRDRRPAGPASCQLGGPLGFPLIPDGIIRAQLSGDCQQDQAHGAPANRLLPRTDTAAAHLQRCKAAAPGPGPRCTASQFQAAAVQIHAELAPAARTALIWAALQRVAEGQCWRLTALRVAASTLPRPDSSLQTLCTITRHAGVFRHMGVRVAAAHPRHGGSSGLQQRLMSL